MKLKQQFNFEAFYVKN